MLFVVFCRLFLVLPDDQAQNRITKVHFSAEKHELACEKFRE